MTFAGVRDIEVMRLGVPDVFAYSIGQRVNLGDVIRYVVAIDYDAGTMLLGAGVRRTFWQRVRAAWRVLRGRLA